MKTVTVTVTVQMNVNTGRRDILPQVQDALEEMNNAISGCEIEAQPQIFISDVSDSDIIEDNVMCLKHANSEALPDEEGNCSTCGGDCLEQ